MEAQTYFPQRIHAQPSEFALWTFKTLAPDTFEPQPHPKTMKTTIFTVFLALNFATVSESSGLVDCSYGALCYSEEIPEDGPTAETVQEEENPATEPAEAGFQDLSV